MEPFALLRPGRRSLPVVISSPHSGTHYPPLDRQRLGVHGDTLAILSDGPVHELFVPSVAAGATMIHAGWSRAWIDLNRDAAELDDEAISGVPASFGARRSLRVRAGLGVVPTRLGERLVHQRRLAFRDVAARIQTVHMPYHDALSAECVRLVATFGQVLLLDCHSMPGSAAGPQAVPDIVLGDRFGRSCSPSIVTEVEQAFCRGGFSVVRNQPFAGGWITERHGRPARGIHALQIEIRRDLFIAGNAGRIGEGDGAAGPNGMPACARLRAVAADLTERLGAALAGSCDPMAQAAE